MFTIYLGNRCKKEQSRLLHCREEGGVWGHQLCITCFLLNVKIHETLDPRVQPLLIGTGTGTGTGSRTPLCKNGHCWILVVETINF